MPVSPLDVEPSATTALELTEAVRARARQMVLDRLIEVVAWPESRLPRYERQLAGDVLVGLIRYAAEPVRRRCADNLLRLLDPPKPLLRYLSVDEISVAGPLLEEGQGFDDSDLISAVRGGVAAHWLAIAKRKQISEAVCETLVQQGDPAVLEALLRNQGAKLSVSALDRLVARSRLAPSLTPFLARRAELRPAQALVAFWWADHPTRTHILRRFAIDRSVLIAELGEAFSVAASEGWVDAEARKALQVIERRQRSRRAAQQSKFGSIESAITVVDGAMTPLAMQEIAHMAGIKPATAAQIFADPGGEPVAVFAKAIVLRRQPLLLLWKALGRSLAAPESLDSPLGRMLYVYDTLATAKAQTVLRYWNWSFTADALSLEDMAMEDGADVSVARRNAALLLQRSV